MSQDSVQIVREHYGPFERISLTRQDARFPRPPQLSVYRIGDTLIDTGSSLTAEALVQAVADRPPRRVLCTHQHEDHIGGVQALRHAYGAIPVFAPRPHVPWLVDFDRVPNYRAIYWGNPSPVTDAIAYDVGEPFEAAGVRLDTIASPGHTPGHVSFVARDRDSALVLTGDLYTSSPFVAWFESSAPCLLASCRALSALAPNVVMMPTHGRVRADGAAALRALADQVEPVCERVERAAHDLAVGDAPSDAQLWRVSDAVFGPDVDGQAVHTEGEWSTACFVRSVLAPIRELPAAPVRANA